MDGKLIYISGSMGGSKSLRLLALAHNLFENNIEFLLLKPSIDTRESDSVVRSRAGLERPCTLIDKDDNLFDIINEYKELLNKQGKELLYILIDECQFLTSKQVEELSQIADTLHITAYCYGLRTDFQSHLFEGSKRLFELADKVEFVKSMCACGNRAIMNARFVDGEIVTDGDQVFIGGEESYTPLCRKCYMEKINEKKSRENCQKN